METNPNAKVITETRRRDMIIIAVVTLALLLPFSDKAFHIDDTLFVWAAEHLTERLFPFYWFDVNWFGSKMGMYQAMKNPPLTSYFIAIAASIVGWSERALHLVFLIPAVSLGMAMYLIAEKFTRLPLLAILAGLVTPVFLVSATTVMSDVLMLDFWCWAVFAWIIGSEKKRLSLMLLAGLLIALSTLTKYFAMSLVPLLAVYSLYRRERLRLWVPGLALAVSLLLAYQLLTKQVYGRGLLLDAAAYASNVSSQLVANRLEMAFTGLAFAGACLVTVLFYAGFIWKKKTLLFWGALFIVLIPLIANIKVLDNIVYYTGQGRVDWGYLAQVSVFIVAGLSLIVLAARDFIVTREAASLLLLLWIMGTFIFATFVNWTNNGRSNLPMLPAAGILIARALERRYSAEGLAKRWFVYAPLVPALVLSLFVSYADYAFAGSARSTAAVMKQRYIDRGATLWFQGHWGFQYYMESFGAMPLDLGLPRMAPGDIVVRAENNYIVPKLPEYLFTVRLLDVIINPLPRSIAVMSFRPKAAGFYSSVFGAIPYVLGHTENDIYTVIQLKRPRAVQWPPPPGTPGL